MKKIIQTLAAIAVAPVAVVGYIVVSGLIAGIVGVKGTVAIIRYLFCD